MPHGVQGSDSGLALAAPSDLRFSSPGEYAVLLRRAHDLALSGAAQPNVSPSIWASWQRALAGGIDPDRHLPRHLHEVSDVVSLRGGHPLAAVMPALTELLADETASGRHLLVLTNAQGEILWRVGSRAILRQADGLEFVEGADWSEHGIGTNAISEVLVSGRAAQLFSAEHLVRTHHAWACTASPIRDQRTGELLGVLNVSGPLDTVTVDSMRMVKTGVRLAEELMKARPGSATGPAGPAGVTGSAGSAGATGPA
ncbi:GAF domain-containing protein, partial [Cryobacterium algoritolerans]